MHVQAAFAFGYVELQSTFAELDPLDEAQWITGQDGCAFTAHSWLKWIRAPYTVAFDATIAVRTALIQSANLPTLDVQSSDRTVQIDDAKMTTL